MSSFTKPLTVTKLNAREWKVENSFTYSVCLKESSIDIAIPEGFVTDFASVPRAFWTIFQPDGK